MVAIIIVVLVILAVLPRIVRMIEDVCHYGPQCHFAGPRPGVTEERVGLEDLPLDVKEAFKAALAAGNYAIVAMDEDTMELPVVVAAPDVCEEGEVYSPYTWHNTCAHFRITVGEGGTQIWHPLTMRLEMRKWAANGELFAVCNDPAGFCNSLEAISLKAEWDIEWAFAATFSAPYYGVPYVVRINTSASRRGYIMSLAFRRGIIITPVVKAAEKAATAFSARGDTRKVNRGGEERARLQRNARTFVRSQKEVELN